MATTSPAPNKTSIQYIVSFNDAQAHYADIELQIDNLSGTYTDLKLPVWTPGSYLVREFARNVESLDAQVSGKFVPAFKISKNTWRIEHGISTQVTVRYRVYAFEVSVRTSFIDRSHAFLSTSGLFLYPDGGLKEPSIIQLIPHPSWAKVSTSLEPLDDDPFILYSPDYDTLFDSPIELGNQDIIYFDVDGVHYEIAMQGGGNYVPERLIADFTVIIREEAAIFKENPNHRYVFIVHNYAKGGGGLEHLRSTVLGASREGYTDAHTYTNLLSLVAHEHFHLWNVKRLRPIALGPFDYENENYTHSLWMAEGFTAYYDNLIIKQTNLCTTDAYLQTLADDITLFENQPGKHVQNLYDASFDAWIKFYRPNENTVNSAISYYVKGSFMALFLDLYIIHYSKGSQSLNDVMLELYQTFYKQLDRGFTEAELKQVLEKYTGCPLDAFYDNYITGTAPVNYNEYLQLAGYCLKDKQADKITLGLGVHTRYLNNKLLISHVLRDSPAWIVGLNVNDQLIAINGEPITETDRIFEGKVPGDDITLTVNRDGIAMDFTLTLYRNPEVKYEIEELPNITELQQSVRAKWLKL